MSKVLRTCLGRLRHNDEGVTLVEYGVAVALAVLVGTTALAALSGNISTSMGNAGTAMTITP